MRKNLTGQKLKVFAFDSTTSLPKTGDAANITAYVSIDYGTVTVLGDTSASEMSSSNAAGYYLFDLTQGETNGDSLAFSAKSSTANIVAIAVPATEWTEPTTGLLAPVTAGRTLVVDASGLADANMVKVGPTASGTAQTARDLGLALPAAAPNANGGLPILSASGTTLGYTIATLTTYTGNTLQTGDTYALANGTSGFVAIAGYIDTEVAAILTAVVTEVADIKAKTDNLPTAPAAVGSLMGLADGAITDAKVTVPSEAAGRPTTMLTMLRRLFEWTANKRTRSRTSGDVVVFGADNSTTLETQTQSTVGSTDAQSKGA